MSSQLPNLTQDQQQQLLKDIKYGTLYPYTYSDVLLNNSTNFPTLVSSSSNYGYERQVFTAPSALGIVAIKISASLFLDAGNFSQGGYGFIISFNSAPQFGLTPPLLTSPFDSGNDIYRGFYTAQFVNTTSTFNDFIWFAPYNIYMATGQQLYLFTVVNTNDYSTSSALEIIVTKAITLYTRPTGLKV